MFMFTEPVLMFKNYNLTDVVTPINHVTFGKLLREANYDDEATQFIENGLKFGFRLQYNGAKNVQVKAPNLKLNVGSKTELWNKVMNEVSLGRYAGPYEEPPFENFIQSPIGLVPKDGGTKTRLIFHLSYPKNSGRSVNANTPHKFCHVVYKDFDHAIRRCLEEAELGDDIYLAKADLVSAFRNLGIHPEDWRWLVLKAQHPKTLKVYYFVDKCLPFGHAISCALFQKISDGIEWVFRHRSKKESVNYLDDFLFVAVYRDYCNRQLKIFIQVCYEICFPVSTEKTCAASKTMVFLGLLIDALNNRVSVPFEKVLKAVQLIENMIKRKSRKTTLLELQTLAGYLNFLCKAIIPGRPFTRRLYFACSGLEKSHHHTKIKQELKLDLIMWLEFLNHPSVYSRSFIDFSNTLCAHEIYMYTDASRNFKLGAGGVCQRSWFMIQWDPVFMEQHQPSIEYLELYAVVVAVVNWIYRFKNQRIILFCDNISVVYMINRNTSSCKQCLALIRILVLESMLQNVRVFARYVNTKRNTEADLLSRLRIKRFRQITGDKFELFPTQVPDRLWPLNKIWQS